MASLLVFAHMKPNSIAIILSVCAVISLTGAGCAWQNNETQATATKNERKLSVFNKADKDDYSDNIRIKIEDLEIHLGKLRDYRINIAPSSQATFDAYVSEFEADIKEFSGVFEAFKATPLDQFLAERLKVNEALLKVENLYLKIITDFKVNFENQP